MFAYMLFIHYMLNFLMFYKLCSAYCSNLVVLEQLSGEHNSLYSKERRKCPEMFKNSFIIGSNIQGRSVSSELQL